LFSAAHRMTAMAAAVAVLFAVGLTQLFLLRFEAGDVYPAYSSLRTDPLGTRVLFESLNRLAAHSARRNFRPPDQIVLTGQTTLLVCGLGDTGLFLNDNKIRSLMDRVAQSGARLVLTYSVRPRKRSAQPEAGNKGPGDEKAQPPPPEEKPADASPATPADDWRGAASLGFDFKQPREKPRDDTALCIDPRQDRLPHRIAWRTPLVFDLQDPAWQTLYTWQDQPVVVQRPWGRGIVVMSADSYLLSNEALRSHRFAGLLAWLVVPGHTVIFDEFHHGLAKQPGIAGLARQYRLHGVFGALIIMVILFIWRQAAVFAPPEREPTDAGVRGPAAGRDTGQGLVNLTRLHIHPKALLGVCFEAWRPYGARRFPEALAAQARDLVMQAQADPRQYGPVRIYRQICELLKQGKRP
jgi:Domain of unknown function (DUF4350)